MPLAPGYARLAEPALHQLCHDNMVHLHGGFGAKQVQGGEGAVAELKHGIQPSRQQAGMKCCVSV